MKKHKHLVAITALVAGVVYNAWLLGYWLNPGVARHDLASELEAIHQPYNWLFVGCDIACGLLITLLAAKLWRSHRRSAIQWGLVGYASFGLLTLTDALLPLHCDPSIQRCPNLLHDPLLIAHGFCSIAASLGLFLAVVLLWWHRRRDSLLQALIIGYVLFGVFSAVAIIRPGQDSWAQHYALLLDGVCITVVPLTVLRLKPKPQRK